MKNYIIGGLMFVFGAYIAAYFFSEHTRDWYGFPSGIIGFGLTCVGLVVCLTTFHDNVK